MALAYRTGSAVSAGNSSGSALVINRPTGTADGDIVVVAAYLENGTNTWSGVPSGFQSAFRQANTGAFSVELFYKRASSEPTTYTFTPATGSVWRALVAVAYSGGTGTGALLDVANGAQGDAQTEANQIAPSITTSGANRLIVMAYGNFTGNNPTAMTGFATNIRIAAGICIADALLASAGASGTTRPSNGAGVSSSEDYAALHAAIISDTATGSSSVSPSISPSSSRSPSASVSPSSSASASVSPSASTSPSSSASASVSPSSSASPSAGPVAPLMPLAPRPRFYLSRRIR